MVTYAHIAQVELYKVIVAIPALIPEGVAVGGLTAEVKVLEPIAVA